MPTRKNKRNPKPTRETATFLQECEAEAAEAARAAEAAELLELQREASAVMLQSIARGHSARVVAHGMRVQKEQQCSAMMLQSAIRGFIARKAAAAEAEAAEAVPAEAVPAEAAVAEAAEAEADEAEAKGEAITPEGQAKIQAVFDRASEALHKLAGRILECGGFNQHHRTAMFSVEQVYKGLGEQEQIPSAKLSMSLMREQFYQMTQQQSGQQVPRRSAKGKKTTSPSIPDWMNYEEVLPLCEKLRVTTTPSAMLRHFFGKRRIDEMHGAVDQLEEDCTTLVEFCMDHECTVEFVDDGNVLKAEATTLRGDLYRETAARANAKKLTNVSKAAFAAFERVPTWKSLVDMMDVFVENTAKLQSPLNTFQTLAERHKVLKAKFVELRRQVREVRKMRCTGTAHAYRTCPDFVNCDDADLSAPALLRSMQQIVGDMEEVLAQERTRALDTRMNGLRAQALCALCRFLELLTGYVKKESQNPPKDRMETMMNRTERPPLLDDSGACVEDVLLYASHKLTDLMDRTIGAVDRSDPPDDYPQDGDDESAIDTKLLGLFGTPMGSQEDRPFKKQRVDLYNNDAEGAMELD
jgi:hypothetical protein